MNLIALLAADSPVDQIAKTFGANLPALIANAISFVLVALILKKWAIGPIQALLDERRETIAQGLANAEKTRSELATAQSKAKEILAQAGAQANKVIEEARAAAASVSENERQKAIAEAQQILDKARQAGDAELARLKGELRKEFGRLVVAAAARSTGGVLTPEQHTRLSDDAVRQLSA
jgi:F-type H+-transporting ATPase subunit b